MWRPRKLILRDGPIYCNRPSDKKRKQDMMKTAITALALALAPTAAFAQMSTANVDTESYGPKAGDTEFTLSGSGYSNKDFDNNTFGISGSLAKYLTDNVAIGLRQSVNWTDPQNGSDQWGGFTRGFADYVFDLKKFRPYLGVSVGGIYGDNFNDTFAAGPEAGLKYYADKNTFVFAQTEYQFTFDDVDNLSNDSERGLWQHTVGVGFNF